MGGDEFVVLLKGVSLESASGTIERLRDAVAESGAEEYGRVVYTLSVGAAEWRAGMRPEDLLAEADRQMYRAKRQQKLAEDAAAMAAIPGDKQQVTSA
jgi:diguanylate cyclase (GGDEF)-like protein